MKKKILAYICMIACIFGLTACGEGDVVTSNEQERLDDAGKAAGIVIDLFNEYLCQGVPFSVDELNTNEEIEYLCEQAFGVKVDGNAVATGVQSFDSALETIGGIVEIGEADVKLDGKQIIVEVQVTGEKQNAVAEVIFSNDIFMRLESAALNPTASTGELMVRAALNTLIGMGTVFTVLILIIFVISCFKLINKAQSAAEERKAAKAADRSGNAVAGEGAAREEIAEAAEEPEDTELVAVIAAAIAASQGAASADGFVVRSIVRRS